MTGRNEVDVDGSLMFLKDVVVYVLIVADPRLGSTCPSIDFWSGFLEVVTYLVSSLSMLLKMFIVVWQASRNYFLY